MNTLKIAIVSRPEGPLGGDTKAAQEFGNALEALGCVVTHLRGSLSDDLSEFDIYHVYAAVDVSWAFSIALRLHRTQSPFTITPLYYPRDERLQFHHGMNDVYPGYKMQIAQILQCSSALACHTMGEYRACLDLIDYHHTGFVMGAGFSPPAYEPENNEIGEFIVSVGRIEAHKNQIQTAMACELLGINSIYIGPILDQDYARALIDAGATLLGELSHDETCKLISSARVSVLPSFGEIVSQVNQEAAYYGTPMVIGLGHDWEYFGDRAEYCDPTDFRDIARAIARAWDRPRERWTTQPTWKTVAMKHLDKCREIGLINGLESQE